MTCDPDRCRFVVCALVALLLLLPLPRAGGLDSCCPGPGAAADAADADSDRADDAAPANSCPCAYCGVALEGAPSPPLEAPGASGRTIALPLREPQSFFLSAIYRPPLA